MPDTHTVDVHIPAALAERLGGPGPGLDRRVLEAVAVEAYRAGRLTHFELRELLGFETRFELDGFLKGREVDDGITLKEWEQEQQTLDRIGL